MQKGREEGRGKGLGRGRGWKGKWKAKRVSMEGEGQTPNQNSGYTALKPETLSLGRTPQNFWMKLIPPKLEGWGYCMVKIA